MSSNCCSEQSSPTYDPLISRRLRLEILSLITEIGRTITKTILQNKTDGAYRKPTKLRIHQSKRNNSFLSIFIHYQRLNGGQNWNPSRRISVHRKKKQTKVQTVSEQDWFQNLLIASWEKAAFVPVYDPVIYLRHIEDSLIMLHQRWELLEFFRNNRFAVSKETVEQLKKGDVGIGQLHNKKK